jgi:hypothetical protein
MLINSFCILIMGGGRGLTDEAIFGLWRLNREIAQALKSL